MSQPTQICPRCGTEYLEQVDECDWCPGIEPMPVVAIGKAGKRLVHLTDALIAASEVPTTVLEELAKGAC